MLTKKIETLRWHRALCVADPVKLESSMSILNLSAVLMTASLFMAAAAFAQTIWHDGSAHGKVGESRCLAHSMPTEAGISTAILSSRIHSKSGSVASRSF